MVRVCACTHTYPQTYTLRSECTLPAHGAYTVTYTAQLASWSSAGGMRSPVCSAQPPSRALTRAHTHTVIHTHTHTATPGQHAARKSRCVWHRLHSARVVQLRAVPHPVPRTPQLPLPKTTGRSWSGIITPGSFVVTKVGCTYVKNVAYRICM